MLDNKISRQLWLSQTLQLQSSNRFEGFKFAVVCSACFWQILYLPVTNHYTSDSDIYALSNGRCKSYLQFHFIHFWRRVFYILLSSYFDECTFVLLLATHPKIIIVQKKKNSSILCYPIEFAPLGGNSQNLRKFLIFFLTLGLKILRL